MSCNTNLEKLNEIKKKYKLKDFDTGSSIVQVALLTFRINELSKHFLEHKKDNNSKMGFLKLISQRKKMMKYLEKQNHAVRVSLAADLGMRR